MLSMKAVKRVNCKSYNEKYFFLLYLYEVVNVN